MTRSVLVVAAHPDDEALGCGGTLARHTAEGDTVHAIFLTNGVGSRGHSSAEARERNAAARVALAILGVAEVEFYSFPDNQLDTLSLLEVVRAIEARLDAFRPDIVYTHHAGDLNIDHRICQQAVLTAFRPAPGQSVHAIYGFEVCSSTEWAFAGADRAFLPVHFVDIVDYLGAKLAALEAYGDEMRPFPHVRSFEAIKALAQWRGSTVGVAAAEAFSVIREVR